VSPGPRASISRLTLGAALSIGVLAACTGGANQADRAAPTVASDVSATTSLPDAAAPVPVPATIEPSSVPSTGSPPSSTPVELEPLILVAGADGAIVEGAGGDPLVPGPVVSVADDRMGGVVYQEAAGRWQNDPEDTIVWWKPGGRGEPRALLVPTGDQWLSLVDVEIIAGAVTVVYVRSEGTTGPDDFRDTLRLYDIVTGEVTEVATVGGWESGPGQISFGGGLFAVNWFVEAVSGFEFYATDGAVEMVAGDPYGGGDACFDGARGDGDPCFTEVAISDDGTRLGYLEDTRDAAGLWIGTELVVVSRDGSRELARIDLQRAEQVWFPTGLELSSRFALVNRVDSASGTPLTALLIELADASIRELATEGHARFTSSIPGP